MKHRTLIIIMVIFAAALIYPCSAASNITFDPANITVNQGDTRTITLLLDNAPKGLAGYQFSVTVWNPGTVQIIEVSYPSWAALSNTTGVPGESITMNAVDLNQEVQAGATGIVLGAITVQGGTAGTSNISVGDIQLDTDGGGTFFADADPVTIIVSMTGIPVTWTPAQTTVPVTTTTTATSSTGSASSGNGGSGGGGSYEEVVTTGTTSTGEVSGSALATSAPATSTPVTPGRTVTRTAMSTDIQTSPATIPTTAPVTTPLMQQPSPQGMSIIPGGSGFAGIPWFFGIIEIILVAVTLIILYLAVTKKI
jgi:hypothetical protein